VIWDCGIYLGFYTAFFARLTGPSGRVVAFEPDPNNLVRTRANVALNSLHNVDFVHAAIGAPASEATFILSANSNSHLPGTYVGADTNSYASIEQQATTIQVRCLGLDQAIASEHIRPPQLIKIDIEGAELEALSYMHELVQQYRPLIVLELHNPQCDAAAWEFAQRENYTLTSLETGEIIRRQEDVHGTLLCSHN
jgi:FkbM family methyltransferase